MRNKWKRFISVFIIFAMSMNLIPMTTYANEISIIEEDANVNNTTNDEIDMYDTTDSINSEDDSGIIEVIEEETLNEVTSPEYSEENELEYSIEDESETIISDDTVETETEVINISIDIEENEEYDAISIENAENIEFPMYEIEKGQTDVDYGISSIDVEPAPQDGYRYTVLVLDSSGSMSGDPIQIAREAAKKFCSSIMNADGKNYVAIIVFGTGCSILQNYSDNLENTISKIDQIGSSGGTNTNSALLLAKDLINTVPESAIKNIVLLSDGLPESGVTSYSGPYTSSDGSSYYSYANAVYSTAQEIKDICNIYSLGFFHSLSGKELEFGQKVMNDIQNKGYYNVVNAEDLDFAFGEVSDDITESALRKAFINQHRAYIRSAEYDSQIIGGFDEYLSQILNDINNDRSVRHYNFLDAVNKSLSLDLDVTDEYELLLAQLMVNDQSYKGIKESFLLNLQDTTFEMMETINGSLKTVAEESGNVADMESFDKAEKLLAQMMGQPYLSNDYMELRGQYMQTIVQQKIDAKKLKETLKKFKFVEYVIEAADVITTTVTDTFDYITYGQAYMETSKDFVDVLILMDYCAGINAWAGTGEGLQPVQQLLELASLQTAIEEFISGMEDYKENHAKAIAEFAINTFSSETVNKAADKTMDLLFSKVPIFEAVPVLKEILEGGQTLIDILTNTDDTAAAANMVVKLYYMTVIMDETVDMLSDPVLKNGTDDETLFRSAAVFDEAINVYKNCVMMACDYGINYEECCLAKWFRSVENRSWYSTAISIAALDKMLTQNIACHNAGLMYDHKTNVLTYDETKLQVVTIACPVAVTVLNNNGRQIAYLSDDQKDIASGYEHYFHVFENNDSNGDYIKVAIVPDDYKINISGTGKGTMDVGVGTYDTINIGVEENQFYNDIPVDEGTFGVINKTRENTYELYVDGNKIIPEHVHVWNSGTITKASTCTEPGAKTYTCTICNETKTEEIPSTGHNFSTEWTVDEVATCTKVGNQSKHCLNTGCSEKTEVTVIPMVDHQWDAGIINTESTATQQGTKIYTCIVCGAMKTELLPYAGAPAPVESEQGTQVGNSEYQNSQITQNDNETESNTNSSTSKMVVKTNSDGTIILQKYKKSNEKTIRIPRTITIEGKVYTVVGIGSKAFTKCKKMTKLILPSTIKTIKNKAFTGSKKLKTIIIESSKAVTIKKKAFKGLKTNKISIHAGNMNSKQIKKFVKILRKAKFKGYIVSKDF